MCHGLCNNTISNQPEVADQHPGKRVDVLGSLVHCREAPHTLWLAVQAGWDSLVGPEDLLVLWSMSLSPHGQPVQVGKSSAFRARPW